MTRSFSKLLLVSLSGALAACAPDLVVKHQPPPGRATRVVVLPFEDGPGAPGSGALAAGAFAESLLSVPSYELVERGRVDEELKSRAVAAGIPIAESQAVEIGKRLGADAVVLGVVTEFKEREELIFPPASVALSVRMVDVNSGLVSWTASQRFGGYKRLLTWVIWPLGAVATATSPTADSKLHDVTRSIAKALAQAMPPAGSGPAPRAEAAVAAAAPSDVDAPSYHAPERPDDLAVVVGIEGYSELPSAAYAERDAAAVKAHLLALGVPERNIAFLSGSKAVRSSLQKYVEDWLPRLVKDDSRVYFYFSGHGAPDLKTGGAYLVPWDGDAEYLDATGYPVDRLYSKLSALKAKQVLVAMDTCFSGAGGRSVLPKGARPLVTKLQASAVPPNIVALTASSGEQISGTADAQGHGAFTYFLLRGLNGGASSESVRGLYDYLKPRVEDEARRHNRDQTPQLLGQDAGFLLR